VLDARSTVLQEGWAKLVEDAPSKLKAIIVDVSKLELAAFAKFKRSLPEGECEEEVFKRWAKLGKERPEISPSLPSLAGGPKYCTCVK
jgi:hypothetical protein